MVGWPVFGRCLLWSASALSLSSTAHLRDMGQKCMYISSICLAGLDHIPEFQHGDIVAADAKDSAGYVPK